MFIHHRIRVPRPQSVRRRYYCRREYSERRGISPVRRRDEGRYKIWTYIITAAN